MKNIRLQIEYDGSGYHGWQRQKEDRTVQGEIEKALSRITGEKTVLHGSGRTDAGVHALGQVANFTSDTRLDCPTLQKALNSLLAPDVVIQDCRYAPEGFHSRYDARSKIYHYRILNRAIPSALYRQYAWHIRGELDLDAMRAGMEHLLGAHDFKSFESSGSPRKSTLRNLMTGRIRRGEDGYLVFELEADGFLKFMVRNIVGTLAAVGKAGMDPDEIPEILEKKDRKYAGICAPPHGLFLVRVKYGEEA